MHINNIVRFINDKLAGEQLLYDQLLVHLDSVIDDINTALNSCFPAFSDFALDDFSNYPDYNFFPDRYIRSVLIVGVAAKFYTTDEEGIDTAIKYTQDYTKNLFYMVRDYSAKVPYLYQSNSTGALPYCYHDHNENNVKEWFGND